MKPFPIPVVAAPFGPGSQPDEEPLNYIAAPGEMSIFQPPSPRVVRSSAAVAGARALLTEFLAQMARGDWREAGPRRSLLGLEREVVDEINETLGEGEVSARVTGKFKLRIQESVFAGIWRILGEDANGERVIDELEAGRMPHALCAALAAGPRAAIDVQTIAAANPLASNAPAILSELLAQSAAWRGGAAHVINLTLLPMTPEDLACLGSALGTGPVSLLSRGYGDCRITSTMLPHTWWVQYFNSGGSLILDTLEVTDLPEAALAAPEDLLASVRRLREWLRAAALDA